MLPGELPESLFGDKAYDSDPLDADLKEHGVQMITPLVGTGPARRAILRLATVESADHHPLAAPRRRTSPGSSSLPPYASRLSTLVWKWDYVISVCIQEAVHDAAPVPIMVPAT